MVLQNGVLAFYHNDHLGTPQKLTDGQGNEVWSATYAAFGLAVVDAESPVKNNLRFPGQYFDAETGGHWNFQRYYDAETGRYTQVDPIGFAGGVNLYVYVQNNSTNSTDPFGLIAGVDDAAVVGLVILTTATVGYLESPAGKDALKQIANDITTLTLKMEKEIARIQEKVEGPKGVQYSLRAEISGYYPDVKGGIVYLTAGDIWKYGETTNPCDRYPQSWLAAKSLEFVPEMVGSQTEIKISEKLKIYSYFFAKGKLPPGNRIFR